MRPVRRRMVARLWMRGMTRREIQSALSRPIDEGGLRNPKTGNPYSLGTIQGDVVATEQEWQEETNRELTELRAREVAELREARRQAWTDGNLTEIRLNVGLEADLLGTKKPAAVDITTGGQPVIFHVVREKSKKTESDA